MRDRRLARRFLALHAALEGPAWQLERDTLLQEWLEALSGDAPASRSRAARRDPALRRACELLGDDLARNVTLAELAAAAGVSRHRLTRLFRAAYGLPPHRFVLAQRVAPRGGCSSAASRPARSPQQTGFFDQSHLHRHFTRTLGMTPGAYAAVLRSDVQDAGARRVVACGAMKLSVHLVVPDAAAAAEWYAQRLRRHASAAASRCRAGP